MTKADPLEALFANKEPTVRATFDVLVRVVGKFGPVSIDPKKSSIHLVYGSTFAGVHPRMKWLDLTLRTEAALSGPRVRAQEQVSRNRWHQDVRLSRPSDIDAELRAWLREAYDLAAG